jgi:hypothetical protein
MSDAPDQRRGATAPFGTPAAPNPAPEAPANMRGTQMSAAVPAPLDPPQLAPADEISGAAVAGATADRDGAARQGALPDVAPREAASDPSMRRAPPTMMSPVVPAPRAGESAPLSPENAVIDVGAPAHAYVAQPGPPPPYGAPGPVLHHGGAHAAHAPGPGGGTAPQRSSSTSLVVIIAAAVAALVLALAVVGVGAYLYMRKRAQAELDERRAQTSGTAVPVETAQPASRPPTAPPAPTAPPPRAQPNFRSPAAGPPPGAPGAPGAAGAGAAAAPVAPAPTSQRRPK